jgi:hypothetical protein
MNRILAVKEFFKNENEVDKTEKVGRFYLVSQGELFIQNAAILDTVLQDMNVITSKLQYRNLSVDEINKIIIETQNKLQNLKSDISIDNVYTNIKLNQNIQTDNNEKKNNIKKTITDWTDQIHNRLQTRFQENGMVEKLISVFDPNELKKLENDNNKWNQYGEKYLEIVEFFKPLFTEKRYMEKAEDWRIFKEIVITHLRTLNSSKEVCHFILKNHRFAVTTTLTRIAQIFFLVPPTTVSVESGFSILNEVKDDRRNCLNQDSINFIMMIKVNVDQTILDSLLNKTAKEWLNNKKRRNLSQIFQALGIKKYKWQPTNDDESEECNEIENEFDVSGLHLISELEKEETPFKESDLEKMNIAAKVDVTIKDTMNVNKNRKKKAKQESDWEEEISVLESIRKRKRPKIDDNDEKSNKITNKN